SPFKRPLKELARRCRRGENNRDCAERIRWSPQAIEQEIARSISVGLNGPSQKRPHAVGCAADRHQLACPGDWLRRTLGEHFACDRCQSRTKVRRVRRFAL